MGKSNTHKSAPNVDIVERLRKPEYWDGLGPQGLAEAADEIERLRKERDVAIALQNAALSSVGNSTDEVLQMRDERDAARRMVCQALYSTDSMRRNHATICKWDCYKEAPDAKAG